MDGGQWLLDAAPEHDGRGVASKGLPEKLVQDDAAGEDVAARIQWLP